MNKIRILLGLTALLTTLAIGTTNASATFKSENGHTSGPLQLKAGTEPRFSIIVGGTPQITVICKTLENGVWKIRKSETAQSEVLEGGHENLTGQFNGCVTTVIGGTKAATVNSSCELQVIQTGATSFTGGVASDCSITSGTCVITIAASAANKSLSTVTVVKLETKNDEIRSVVTGFVAAPSEKCANIGVTGTTGSFIATAIAHEQTFV